MGIEEGRARTGSLLPTPFCLPSSFCLELGKGVRKWEPLWVCKAESQEITEDLDPGIPELPADLLYLRNMGALCSSQSNTIP